MNNSFKQDKSNSIGIEYIYLSYTLTFIYMYLRFTLTCFKLTITVFCIHVCLILFLCVNSRVYYTYTAAHVIYTIYTHILL